MPYRAGRFERSRRPAFFFALGLTPLARGSARSLAGLLLVAAIAACGACGGAESPPDESTTDVDAVIGRAPAALRGVPSVVSLRPLGGVQPPARGGATMDQFTMAFSPPLLIVGVGRPLTFTNSEEVAHNVTVRPVGSTETLLNADMDRDQSAEVTLEAAGGYDVTCALHPGMTAFVVATPDPYAAFAESDGSFRIEGVPPGPYELTVWSIDPELHTRVEVEVVAGTTDLASVGAGG